MSKYIQDLVIVRLNLRSDGEPAIVALLESFRDRSGKHESSNKVVVVVILHLCTDINMWVERSVQTIRARMGTQAGIKLSPDTAMLPLVVGHAVWLSRDMTQT